MRQKKMDRDKTKTISVQGVIELIDYGDSSVPFDAVLITDDEEEFYVEFPNKKTRASEYLNRYVEIKGSLFRRDEHLIIAAKRIIVIDESENDDLQGAARFDDNDDYYESDYDDLSDLQSYIKYSGRSRGSRHHDDY